MDIQSETWKVDFGVAKSLRYHSYRRDFWDKVDFSTKILTIMSGTAVLVTAVGQLPVVSGILAGVVAFFSAADAVLGFSIKARTHDGLYKSFSRLAQSITEKDGPTEDDVREWRRKRLEIEMDEPSIVDLLERRCSAEEAKARGCDLRPDWVLNRWQTFFSQFDILPAMYQGNTPGT